jgi:Glycosyltransferase like family
VVSITRVGREVPLGIEHTVKVPSVRKITFVVAVNNRKVFENNFLISPCLRGSHAYEILVQERFESAAKAYNDAIRRSTNELIVFCHQDLILPESWISELDQALASLERFDSNWGVLGCSGMTCDRHHWRYIYSSGLGVSGKPLARPEPVQTLDEIVLVLRKSSNLTFDEQLPHFHFYGTDICLRAASLGMTSYVISAFCIHNTHQSLILPKEFYDCCEYIRRTWKKKLPIQTTCICITRSNIPIYIRRLRELHLRYIRRKEVGAVRVTDSRSLLQGKTPIP